MPGFLHPLLLPSVFPSIRGFFRESDLHIRWPKYRSFSFCISPSSDYSGLISFRIDWFDLLESKRLSRVSQAQFKTISSLALSLLYVPALTSVHRCSGKGLHLAMTGEPRGFSRVTAGFSSYDGEFRLPLVLDQASPIFHSSCEGKLGIALE